MTNESEKLDRHIQSLLDGLRLRIRTYVWIEGLALAGLWIGLTFWIALGIDYLPVLLTASEFPWPVRALILALIVGVLGLVLYRWIFRRAFVRLADRSMALLLERQYEEFHDSLVTTVELSARPDHASGYNSQMLSHTDKDAVDHSWTVQLRRVFNLAPLTWSVSGALLIALTIGLFAYFANSAFVIAASRIYLLEERPWPRQARIELVGLETQYRSPIAGGAYTATIKPFDGGRARVANGSSVVLKVRALAPDAPSHEGPIPVVPKTCTISYRTEDGHRGSQNMQKIGRPRDGYQLYSFDGKPLKGILSSLQFQVVGYDHRIGDYFIDVVDSPAVIETQLECVFPDYMVDLASGSWTPRTTPWATGTQLPRGTKINIRARSNKPLQRAYVYHPGSDETQTVQSSGPEKDQFSIEIPSLDDHWAVEIWLHDTDELVSETPQRMFITAVPDEAPQVDVSLVGIGTAVTPDVTIPIQGTVRDDYGVSRAWVDVQAPADELAEYELVQSTAGEVAASVDFRALRDDAQKGLQLTPGAGNQLVLTVRAADNYDLQPQPHIGEGDRYELDIVTADQLLAILEREEAGLRRRLEQIFDEMSEARDYLVRVSTDSLSEDEGGQEPEDRAGRESEPGDRADDDQTRAAERVHSLRSLYAQRALLQSRKSAQEVLGVAETFRDIRQQLINNRIDAEDRKSRLEKDIADPLQRIGEEMFADLELQIEALESRLEALSEDLSDQGAATAVDEATTAAVQQADDLLAELEDVLNRLIKFETYAELLDIVRKLIEDQDSVIERTKNERKKEALEGLLN